MGSEGGVLTVYHGSEKIIASPLFGGSKDNNDYGNGFYCSENADLAREWSVDENRDGFLNSYKLNLSGLQILYLNGGSYSILHWLAILLENRRFQITAPLPREARRYLLTRFHVPYRDADIIVGYRADDSYFSLRLCILESSENRLYLRAKRVTGRYVFSITNRWMLQYGIQREKNGIDLQGSGIFVRIGRDGKRGSSTCPGFWMRR